jgi:thiol-disulfide isomerase/thioredoxin
MIRRMRWAPLIGAVAALLAMSAASVTADDDSLSRLKVSRAGAGAAMPSFQLTTLDGKVIESSGLVGKIVVLNFWATWCGPCKEEMPALDRLSRQFAEKDVAVLTITNDPERRGIEHFMKQVGSALPVLLDEHRDVSLAFMVRGLPTTVFVGKNGTILGRAVGPRAWDSPDAIELIRSLREARP